MKRNTCPSGAASLLKAAGKCMAWFLAAVVLFALLAFFYILFGGGFCKDLKAWWIKREYASMELPDETERVEVVSYVGNTVGTGNLTEIWVGMLVHSELPKEELETYFADYTVWEVPDDLGGACLFPNVFMDCTFLEGKDSGEGYFLIHRFYDAFSQMDLRGH